jgi:hypothetical protein
MRIDEILYRFSGVRPAGPDQWMARCSVPENHAHGDRTPSLSIAMTTGGRVLLHCHAGCQYEEVRAAAGLEDIDLAPHIEVWTADVARTRLEERRNGRKQQREAAATSLSVAASLNGRPTNADGDDGIVSMVDIEMQSIRWIERPIWQQSAFHLLAGVKGAGKGTYLARFAANLTTGGGKMLFVSSEDSASIDLKPRLVAAGAIIERCYLVRRHVVLPADIGWLRSQSEAIGGIGSIVIDPVANHIGDRNSNSDAEVRDAIAPLNGLADELGCAIIGIRHVGKDRRRGAVSSILGSTAWVDTPRVVAMIVRDDEDDTVRHIQVVAGNRSSTRAGTMFRIEAVQVGDLAEPITLAVDLGESIKDIDDLLGAKAAEPSNSEQARDLILDTLETADGMECESDALDALVAAATGLKAKTVQNNRTKLKDAGLIGAYPVKDEEGEIKRWMVRRTSAVRP